MLNILIVEDEFSARKLLVEILSKYGHCDVAINGVEAIEAYLASIEEENRYDLICLDIMMPEKDGYETLTEIRQIEQEKKIDKIKNVKIIMVTALGEYKNISKAFQEQCEAYIVKPIKIDNLIKAMQEVGLKV